MYKIHVLCLYLMYLIHEACIRYTFYIYKYNSSLRDLGPLGANKVRNVESQPRIMRCSRN